MKRFIMLPGLIKAAPIFILTLILVSCNHRGETIKPVFKPVSESVYASGVIKSVNQYQAFATVSGVVKDIFVTESDRIKAGEPILSIAAQTQQLQEENAAINAHYAAYNLNRDKLDDALQQVKLAENKLRNDSLLYFRQKALWDQQVGTKVEMEQRQLNYQDAKTSLYSVRVRYRDLQRQLELNARQSQKNLAIAKTQRNDFILRSNLDGIVYNTYKKKGEQVSPATPLALVGAANRFVLEMQIDEDDIVKLKLGQLTVITMDSYKGKVFNARVSKIYPVLDERSKTMLVEAEFIDPPATLYPGISFEANIIIQTKPKALVIPRNYLINDSLVITAHKDTIKVKTGLKDYRAVEIISGLDTNSVLQKPAL